MIDFNGVIIGLLLIGVYIGLFALLVLKFKRRTSELQQQLLVASQRKLDALHHVCHSLFVMNAPRSISSLVKTNHSMSRSSMSNAR